MAILKFPTVTKKHLETGVIYCADNLEVMKELPENSVDLVYIDPPFFTGRKYETIWKDTVEVAYRDYRKGGIEFFVGWLTERLDQMHRILKPTGSLFVHMDVNAVHYVKCALDKIFGLGNPNAGRSHFINEIIWCYDTGGKGKKHFPKKHDTILWYAKTKNYKFNYDEIALPRDPSTMHEPVLTDENGKQYQRNIKNGKEYRYYLDKGVLPLSWWTDIQALNPSEKERVGWDTQKPIKLLERIIKATTQENDVVADFFCGCGTTLVASHQLNRQYIGCDISPKASQIIRERLANIGEECKEITMLNMSRSEVLRLSTLDFQRYMVRCLGGNPNPKATGDNGVDGWLISDGTPIQVTTEKKFGRERMDGYEKHLKKNGRFILVAMSFTKGCFEEQAVLQKDGFDFVLKTMDDILKESFEKYDPERYLPKPG